MANDPTQGSEGLQLPYSTLPNQAGVRGHKLTHWAYWSGLCPAWAHRSPGGPISSLSGQREFPGPDALSRSLPNPHGDHSHPHVPALP